MAMSNKIIDKLNKSSIKASKEISTSLKVLEDHLLTVQSNQLEFEKYLKDIQQEFKEHEKRINYLKERSDNLSKEHFEILNRFKHINLSLKVIEDKTDLQKNN